MSELPACRGAHHVLYISTVNDCNRQDSGARVWVIAPHSGGPPNFWSAPKSVIPTAQQPQVPRYLPRYVGGGFVGSKCLSTSPGLCSGSPPPRLCLSLIDSTAPCCLKRPTSTYLRTYLTSTVPTGVHHCTTTHSKYLTSANLSVCRAERKDKTNPNPPLPSYLNNIGDVWQQSRPFVFLSTPASPM